MSLTSKITAYGTPGIVAAGAVAIWGQSLLQWVTQPSHMLPVAAITAVGAITAAKRRGKDKPEQEQPKAVEQSDVDTKLAELAEQLRQRALPKPTTVIDYTAQGQEVSRTRKV